MDGTATAMDGMVTPPFRVSQDATHIHVEAQCPDPSTSSRPQAVCDGIVFALRYPPYYLPLHFPAPLQKVQDIHQAGSIVTVHLLKTEPGLEFIGLKEIQPTMYAPTDGISHAESSTSRPTASSSSSSPAADPEAQTFLNDVLQREKMTTVDDAEDDQNDKATASVQEASAAYGTVFEKLSATTIESNRVKAEDVENKAFDEQAYLDAHVDEHAQLTDLLAWTYQPSQSTTPIEGAGSSSTIEQPHLPLLLLDILYAHHLALVHSSGPPIYAWLLSSFSRSLSAPPAPPLHDDDSALSVLRGGFRRGLVFPLNRSWKVCQRAADDLITNLSAGKPAILASLSQIVSCLQEGVVEAPEGPEEAQRWDALVSHVVQPLAEKVAESFAEETFTELASQVKAALPQLTKSSVAESWDLELLEKMAEKVLAEAESEQEARHTQVKDTIDHLCRQLTPPVGLQEGFDAFARPLDDETRMFCERWRSDDATRLLRGMSKEVTAYLLRSRKDDTSLLAKILIAVGRFLDSDLPWCTATSKRLAQSLLSRRILRPTLPLLREILATHLRQLFTSPTLGSVNEAGRLRHETANLVPSAKAGLIDETQRWKGQGGGVTFANIAGERNVGAGSHVILALALRGIPYVSTRQGEDTTMPLETLWPLILPPLMTLLQDSDPLWRLRGVRVFLRSLLTDPARGDHHPWGRSNGTAVFNQQANSAALTLLQRSNLIPLIQETLSTDLTYLTHKQGVSLYDISLQTLLFLADHTLEKESRTQAEEYMRLVQDGILRTWTFMPRNASSDEEEEHTTADLLSITFHHLTTLAERLGPLRARYVDVVLEFLVSQVGVGLYESLRVRVRLRGRAINRAAMGFRALRSLIETTTPSEEEQQGVPPNVLKWCTPCLIATCKAWLALVDHGLIRCGEDDDKKTWRIAAQHTSSTKQVELLVDEIRGSWDLWRRLAPVQAKEVYERVKRREKSIECVA